MFLNGPSLGYVRFKFYINIYHLSIYAAGVNYQFYLYYRLDAPLFTELGAAAVCMLHVYIFSIFTHRHNPKLLHTNENMCF